MRQQGNRCETLIYERQRHGFFNYGKSPTNEYFIKTSTEMDKFLSSLGFLSGMPSVEAWLAGTDQ